MRMSDRRASSWTISRPPSVRMSATMLRLLRLIPRKAADSPSMNGGPMRRASSPPLGFSTFTTSAPMSPSVMAQYGPAII